MTVAEVAARRVGDGALAAARQGAAEAFPLMIAGIPFGLVAGAAAIDAGLTGIDAAGFSAIVFAGASQLVAIDLLGRDAPVAVAVLTALVINLRMLMYSASLAPGLAHVPRRSRAVAAYLLTDQAYAVSIARTTEHPDRPHRLAHYVGAGLTMWLMWQPSTMAGVLLGASIPDTVPLDFALPMVFLVLLVPAIKDRPTATAATVAGVGATALGFLPANLGMFVSAVAAIVAGTAVALREGPAAANGKVHP